MNNIRKIKAIEAKNKKLLLKINHLLDEKSGIYFLTRTDENGEHHFYVGQARRLLTRMAQHMVNFQYIDLSIRAHGFYSEDNPYGYKLNFLHFPVEELDEKEKHYIKMYLDKGWISKNKTAGGQGEGKTKIGEFKPPKTYREGVLQGKKTLARELSHIIEKHLEIGLKEGKQNNKISINALEKFKQLLNEENY